MSETKYPLNGEFYTTDDDVEMILTPDDWPLWPLLPLKYRGDDPSLKGRVAYVLDVCTPPPTIRVWLKNMHEKARAGDPHINYANATEVVAAGWRVD